KKAAMGGTLFAVAGVAGGVVVIMFSFFAAYLLMTWGIWDWAAFLIVTGFYVVLAAILIGIGLWRMKKMGGASRTRRTVKDDIAMLRRGGGAGDQPALTE
ncbi:MAG TPA: phage holin family protein, partial [Actinoallomurus sp.]|nr:phage holin family protein [Actinoallomurus sp.]